MPVIDTTVDAEALTLTLVAEFPVPVERLWAAFTDPRQLERFWGPPGWPATFTEFDFRVGGVVKYFMTGPRGEKAGGQWDITAIDEPRLLEVRDRFAGDDGEPIDTMPEMAVTFDFVSTETGSRLVNVGRFSSTEALEQVLAMGVTEGLTSGINQLDYVLQDLRAYAEGKGVQVEILDDTHIRVQRAFAAPCELIARAHIEPELMRQWMLGPDGWKLIECVLGSEPGAQNRSVWEPEPGTEGEAFGFEGETLVYDPPRRLVTTERMIGMPGEPAINDLSLYEEDGVTLLTLLIEYPDAATQEMVLGTGMVDGMEASYQRLERELA